MNKFKKVMLGALSVLTLGLFVATGAKVDAASQDYTFDLDLTSYSSSKNYSVVSKEDTNVTHSINVSATGTNSSSKSYTGNSIISSETGVSYQQGVKMESASYIKISTTGSWTLTVLFGCKTANKPLLVCDTSTGTSNSSNVTVTGGNTNTTNVATITATSDTAGDFYIRRNGKEEHVFEIKLVDNFDASSNVDVKFYDNDKTTEFDSKSVAVGETTTAPANKPAAPSIGMTFDKWLNVDDDSVFSESTTFDEAASFYATYKTDTNYSVTSGNVLDTTTIADIHDEGFTTISSKTNVTSTKPYIEDEDIELEDVIASSTFDMDDTDSFDIDPIIPKL